MKQVNRRIHETLDILLLDETIHSVTGFISPLNDVKERVRITRSKNGNGIHLDIGKPNYREREFLKKCRRAKCSPKKFWISSFIK